MKIKTVPTGPIMANCYVVYDENGKAAVIDPGSFDSEVREAVSGLEVEYILLTHGHFDHILGAGELQQATGAKILIHALDRECLTDGKANLLPQFSDTGSINLTADRLLEEGDVISFGDILLRVLHTPGHSRGSVCFLNENEQLIFTGDTLFAQGFGRTDFYGSNPADMVSSLERLADLQGNYRVLPGHGPATSLNAERKYLKCFL